MENATKALLIAASVLIVIVLIAVGVLLLGKTSDTSEQAGQVGNSLSLATDSAADDIFGGRIVQTEELKKLFIDKFEMVDMFNGMTFGPTVKVSAYFFQGYYKDPTWFSTDGKIIPRNVRLAEAPSYGEPICLYDKACGGAKAYLKLTQEYFDRNNVSYNK